MLGCMPDMPVFVSIRVGDALLSRFGGHILSAGIQNDGDGYRITVCLRLKAYQPCSQSKIKFVDYLRVIFKIV